MEAAAARAPGRRCYKRGRWEADPSRVWEWRQSDATQARSRFYKTVAGGWEGCGGPATGQLAGGLAERGARGRDERGVVLLSERLEERLESWSIDRRCRRPG